MRNDYSLDDLRLFWVVARLGSFTKAAEHLTMPVSTLSRRIAQLEGRLAIRLLHRDAHRLSLTEIGLRYLDRCDPLFQELNTISSELHDELHVPRGRLRIAAPITVAQQWLGDSLSRFLLQYPHIQLDVTLSNNNIDLMDSGIDLAIRAGEQQTQEWIARPLGQVAMLLCAGRQLAVSLALTHPGQLDSVPLVWSRPVRVWRLQDPQSGQTQEYRPSVTVRLAVDDMATAAHAVAAGLGVGLLPYYLMAPWLNSGAVVPVLAPWQGLPRPLYLLYRDRGQQPLRLRLLIDFLQAEARTWQLSIIDG